MILVLGPTGNVGGEVARQLVAAGERPRLLARDPDRLRDRLRDLDGRAEIVRGDLADPGSLAPAMAGIDRLFLVSAGSELARLERNAVDAAVAAGVRHVVKLSVLTAEAPRFLFARWHAESERHLMASGLAWTMLRPGNFMSNTLAWAPTIRAQGAIYQPTGSARWASIDPADVGAAAVHALTTAGHEGQAYPITGPESMDGAGYADVFARVLGRPVAFVDVPPEAARAAMTEGGMPPQYLEGVMDLLATMKAGQLDGTTDALPRLIGRPAATFESWVRRHADAFR